MARITNRLIWVVVGLLAVFVTSVAIAAPSCGASNGVDSCSVSCNAGEIPLCKATKYFVRCECGTSAAPGHLIVSGASSGGTVRVEVLDNACDPGPCTPTTTAAANVTAIPGMSPADFSQDVLTALAPSLGATCSGTLGVGGGAGFVLECPAYHPTFRICDAALGTCPEILLPDSGTVAGLGVNLFGFAFLSPLTFGLSVPMLAPAGLVTIAGAGLLLGLRHLRQRRRK